jgi:ribosomal protein L7/L12
LVKGKILKEAYAKVIDLVTGSAVIDYRAIALGLAKAAPEAFLALHSGSASSRISKTHEEHVFELVREVRHMGSLGKVPQIKHVRTVVGLGLKEAKDWVDAMLDPGARLPALPHADSWPAQVEARQLAAANPLSRANDLDVLLGKLLDSKPEPYADVEKF